MTGHLSSNGRCFDIGGATRSALARFEATGELVNTDQQAAGNGSLMRLAPAALFARGDQALAAETGCAQLRLRHTERRRRRIPAACFAVMLTSAVAGASKQELLDPELWALGDLHPEVDEIARGSYLRREPPEIQGSGYVVRCLEAALWAFARTDTFAEGCLLAVNLGDDADTTAAVYGQIAGAFYGESGIPAEWREKLALWETLDALAENIARWRPESTEPAKLPDLHAYWIEPGVLIAGEYPGAQTEAEAERKLASLLDVGVRRFVDLTEEGELEPYEALLQQLAGRAAWTSRTRATRSATSACRATRPRCAASSTSSPPQSGTAFGVRRTAGEASGGREPSSAATRSSGIQRCPRARGSRSCARQQQARRRSPRRSRKATGAELGRGVAEGRHRPGRPAPLKPELRKPAATSG